MADRHESKAVSRRRFLRIGGGSLLAVGIAGCWVESAVEPRQLRVYRQSISIANLPQAFHGLRIAQLTDIHHGPYLSAERVGRAVETVNRLSPHIIALTGDYVHRSSKYIAPCFEQLAALRAPLGVFGVLGNHDHWESAEQTRECMKAAGIYDLTNSGKWIEREAQWLYIAGVGDMWEDEQLLGRALTGVPEDGCAILLSHNPDFNEKMNDRRVRLMLAGHTHGGQVNLPLLGPPLLPSKFGQKYAAGLVSDGWKRVYISRGVGCVTPPVRFNCRPEVTLLTLTPDAPN